MAKITQDLYSESSVQLDKLGALYVDEWGDKFRYVLNAAVALVTADLVQESAEDAQFVSMAVPTAAAIGATRISVTNGTTTVTAGMFEGGHLTISTSNGIGQKFRVLGHSTGTSGATLTFDLDRPLKIALTTSSKVSTRLNPYKNVIINPATTSTGAPNGFTLFAVAASKYAWIQTGGETAVRFDTGTNTANDLLGIEPSLAVAGNVKVSAGTSGDALIGYTRQVDSVDSTVSVARIIID